LQSFLILLHVMTVMSSNKVWRSHKTKVWCGQIKSDVTDAVPFGHVWSLLFDAFHMLANRVLIEQHSGVADYFCLILLAFMAVFRMACGQ
jgi:hypothetical protein